MSQVRIQHCEVPTQEARPELRCADMTAIDGFHGPYSLERLMTCNLGITG